jgi:Flp pilus assembly pilin Flp
MLTCYHGNVPTIAHVVQEAVGESGQTMAEYAVALFAVAIVTVAAFTALGTSIADAIDVIAERL